MLQPSALLHEYVQVSISLLITYTTWYLNQTSVFMTVKDYYV